MKRRLEEESRKTEEAELKRLEKDRERKKALEEWHQSKVKRAQENRSYALSLFKQKKHPKKLDQLMVIMNPPVNLNNSLENAKTIDTVHNLFNDRMLPINKRR